MDIYNIDNRLFMICEFAEELDFETIWNKVGEFNRQEEWGKLMSNYIQALPGHKLEWIKMTRVFSIYK
jgi:L-rhamnose mutarotase